MTSQRKPLQARLLPQVLQLRRELRVREVRRVRLRRRQAPLRREPILVHRSYMRVPIQPGQREVDGGEQLLLQQPSDEVVVDETALTHVDASKCWTADTDEIALAMLYSIVTDPMWTVRADLTLETVWQWQWTKVDNGFGMHAGLAHAWEV